MSQHKELPHKLGDCEKLRLYSESVISKNQALYDALVNAKARSKNWECEAKAGEGKAVSVENEKDEAKEEAQLAWLVIVAASDTKALVEDKLARV